MTRGKYLRWLFEFLSVVAISFILETVGSAKFLIVVPIVAIILLKTIEFRTEVAERHSKVHAQLKLLYNLFPFDPAADVRCTYYVPTWNRKLLQTIDYIPDRGGRGRSFSPRKGIIGRAFTNKQTFVENFKDDKEYQEKMVSKYGYTDKEVMQRSTDRRSYYCHPLMDENHRIHGLVFFDASIPGTFASEDHEDIKKLTADLDLIKDSIL